MGEVFTAKKKAICIKATSYVEVQNLGKFEFYFKHYKQAQMRVFDINKVYKRATKKVKYVQIH